MTIILTPQSKAFYVRNTMILDSFLRGLHSERKLDFSSILFTSDRREREEVIKARGNVLFAFSANIFDKSEITLGSPNILT